MSLFAYAPLRFSVSKVGEDGRGKDGRRKMEDGRRKTGEIPTARLFMCGHPYGSANRACRHAGIMEE
jgi:hypothetical protein